MNIETIWSSILQLIGLAWWVKIITEQPSCTYYFGPFATGNEADAAQAGYVEDLESESATGIHVSIEQRCQPTYLTIEISLNRLIKSFTKHHYDSGVKTRLR